jgi:hypothetical protein
MTDIKNVGLQIITDFFKKLRNKFFFNIVKVLK